MPRNYDTLIATLQASSQELMEAMFDEDTSPEIASALMDAELSLYRALHTIAPHLAPYDRVEVQR